MNFLDQINRIKRLHLLINRKGTGSPDELAVRLNVSRATVFRYLNELKNMGASISYCNYKQSYFYEDRFVLEI